MLSPPTLSEWMLSPPTPRFPGNPDIDPCNPLRVKQPQWTLHPSANSLTWNETNSTERGCVSAVATLATYPETAPGTCLALPLLCSRPCPNPGCPTPRTL